MKSILEWISRGSEEEDTGVIVFGFLVVIVVIMFSYGLWEFFNGISKWMEP